MHSPMMALSLPNFIFRRHIFALNAPRATKSAHPRREARGVRFLLSVLFCGVFMPAIVSCFFIGQKFLSYRRPAGRHKIKEILVNKRASSCRRRLAAWFKLHEFVNKRLLNYRRRFAAWSKLHAFVTSSFSSAARDLPRSRSPCPCR